MTLSDMFQGISLFALLTIIVGVLPFAIAVMYAVRPTERRLALWPWLAAAAALVFVTERGLALLRGVV